MKIMLITLEHQQLEQLVRRTFCMAHYFLKRQKYSHSSLFKNCNKRKEVNVFKLEQLLFLRKYIILFIFVKSSIPHIFITKIVSIRHEKLVFTAYNRLVLYLRQTI